MCVLNRKRKKEKVCRAPAAAFETLASHWKTSTKAFCSCLPLTNKCQCPLTLQSTLC